MTTDPLGSTPSPDTVKQSNAGKVTVEHLQEDLRTLLKDAQVLLSDTRASSKDNFQEKADEVSRAIRTKMDQLHGEAQRRGDQANEYRDDFVSYVQEHPLKSVGGAFLVGMIVSRLMGD
ncbi:MAG: YqjD family protein [Opitutales bacterium]